MSDNLLKEQLDYYRARAQEYDESVQQTGRFAAPEPVNPEIDAEWAQIVAVLHQLKPIDTALELACGTGLWTKELVEIAKSLTALDGAPEMVNTNRAKLQNPDVKYQVADLFGWKPDAQYDLVFFAFWLSHVPPEKLDSFLDSVTNAVNVGGRVFIVDEPQGGQQLSGENEAGVYQSRTLHDGRTFNIVKVYYNVDEIKAALAKRGFDSFSSTKGNFFFSLCGTRTK
jgi:2-polyprenyl-3-methyl-5-hydroxy-6-metoxy-1,4-benzoquinol methylase